MFKQQSLYNLQEALAQLAFLKPKLHQKWKNLGDHHIHILLDPPEAASEGLWEEFDQVAHLQFCKSSNVARSLQQLPQTSCGAPCELAAPIRSLNSWNTAGQQERLTQESCLEVRKMVQQLKGKTCCLQSLPLIH